MWFARVIRISRAATRSINNEASLRGTLLCRFERVVSWWWTLRPPFNPNGLRNYWSDLLHYLGLKEPNPTLFERNGAHTPFNAEIKIKELMIYALLQVVKDIKDETPLQPWKPLNERKIEALFNQIILQGPEINDTAERRIKDIQDYRKTALNFNLNEDVLLIVCRAFLELCSRANCW